MILLLLRNQDIIIRQRQLTKHNILVDYYNSQILQPNKDELSKGQQYILATYKDILFLVIDPYYQSNTNRRNQKIKEYDQKHPLVKKTILQPKKETLEGNQRRAKAKLISTLEAKDKTINITYIGVVVFSIYLKQKDKEIFTTSLYKIN